MIISSVTGIYFSATGNTKLVTEWIAKSLAERLSAVQKPSIDFTLPEDRNTEYRFSDHELVVFGMPVYAGRIPNKILPFVQTLFHGDGTLAVLVVTFGNRSYDDGLMELHIELEENGFHTVAGAAVVANHVMSDIMAKGRPDQNDKLEILTFTDRIVTKVQRMEGLVDPIYIKGNRPVGLYYTPLDERNRPAKFLKAKPQTDMDKCDSCKECAMVCPMGSIDVQDITSVPGICIKCQACIRKCKNHAKYFDDPVLLSHIRMLEHNYSRRAESEYFL